MGPLTLTLVIVAAVSAAVDPTQESLLRAVEKDVLKPWRGHWLAGKPGPYERVFGSAKLELRREKDGVREHRWSAEPGEGYLGAFRLVEDVRLDPVELSEGRPGELRVKARFDLRGLQKDGLRRNDRGLLSLHLLKKGGAWRLARVDRAEMETLTAAAAAFEDVTAKTGLDAVSLHPRTEAIRRGGYALAVRDYDGDGRPDLYVGGRGAGQLLRGEGGRWRDVTAEAGLGADTMVKAALFADLDGDQRVDLVVQRFVEGDDAAAKELVFYRNKGRGAFERAPAKLLRRQAHDRAMSMTAADFDGDGRLDLYMGYPGRRDFTDDRLDADGGAAHQAVFLNKGRWTFEELAGEGPGGGAFAELARPHSALATDADQDGRMDIVVVDDRGYSSRLYLNRGKKGFVAAEAAAGLRNQAWGMMAVPGDYDNDGHQDLYFSNIDFEAGRRALALLRRAGQDESELPGVERLARLMGGNRLYRGRGDGSYEETTEKAGVGWAGEAPAGAQWLDYDNDGLLDLYVANGLWSADPERDETPRFIREWMSGQTARAEGADNRFMASLQASGRSFAGYQRNRLFRNNGDGTFTELGYLAGVDRLEDGYVVAAADLDQDGHVDLVLRNADPPSLKRPFAPVTVLRNKGSKRRSLAVRAPAFGARVTVTAGGRRQTREIQSVQGTVQAEPVAWFGLGEAEKADSVEIRWPSGRVETHADVPAGTLVRADKRPSGWAPAR